MKFIAEFQRRLDLLIRRAHDELRVELVVRSGVRTRKQQQALHEAFLTGRSQIPASHPNRSLHVIGRAADLRRTDGQPIDSSIAPLTREVGLRWGGHFRRPEPWHFDLPLAIETEK